MKSAFAAGIDYFKGLMVHAFQLLTHYGTHQIELDFTNNKIFMLASSPHYILKD